ncbi:hypothetical protein [Lysobacter gummosus]
MGRCSCWGWMVAGRWAFAQNRHALILINQARKFASFEKGACARRTIV